MATLSPRRSVPRSQQRCSAMGGHTGPPLRSPLGEPGASARRANRKRDTSLNIAIRISIHGAAVPELRLESRTGLEATQLERCFPKPHEPLFMETAGYPRVAWVAG